jgi:hypothetical protein
MKFYNITTMKRKAICIALLMILSLPSIMAQNPNQERLNVYKIAFFSKRLNLSSKEAEMFWPLYNDFQDRKSGLQMQRVQMNRKFNEEVNTMSDAEMITLGDKLVELEVLEAELSVKFHKSIKEVLPPAKVLRLYQAENQYKVQLLKELQERRQSRGNL